MKKLVLLIGVLLAQPLYADDALLKKHACLACHNVDKKVVGPAYKDVSAKYRSQKDAKQYLAGKIRNGSVGVWGPIPMPANARVTEAEANQLASYILNLK